MRSMLPPAPAIFTEAGASGTAARPQLQAIAVEAHLITGANTPPP